MNISSRINFGEHLYGQSTIPRREFSLTSDLFFKTIKFCLGIEFYFVNKTVGCSEMIIPLSTKKIIWKDNKTVVKCWFTCEEQIRSISVEFLGKDASEEYEKKETKTK